MPASDDNADGALRFDGERSGSDSDGYGGGERLQSAVGIPAAEPDCVSVYAEALCFAHADGSYGGHQICGDAIHWTFGEFDGA